MDRLTPLLFVAASLLCCASSRAAAVQPTVCTVTAADTLTFTNGVLTTKGAHCT